MIEVYHFDALFDVSLIHLLQHILPAGMTSHEKTNDTQSNHVIGYRQTKQVWASQHTVPGIPAIRDKPH